MLPCIGVVEDRFPLDCCLLLEFQLLSMALLITFNYCNSSSVCSKD
jgi:hypothetical protein